MSRDRKKETKKTAAQGVSPKTRQARSGFERLFFGATRNQLVRRLQQKHRAKKDVVYEGKARETLVGTIDTTTDFIHRPTGEVAEQKIKAMADCINKGQLQNLPFSDPDFFICLNDAAASPDQTIAPMLLHSDLIEFRNRDKRFLPIRQFSCLDPHGPFPITQMASAVNSDIPVFKKELEQIPESEQCYYTVNFSHKQEVMLILVHMGMDSPLRRIMPILRKYLDRFKLSEDEKKRWSFFAEVFNDPPSLSKDAAASLLKFIITKESQETIRFCYGGPFATSTNSNLTEFHHPLIISFLLEISQQSPNEFDAHVKSLKLGKDEELFCSYIKQNKGEEAAELLCQHWKLKLELDEKSSLQYKDFYSKKEYGLAAHVLWRSMNNGKEITLCSMLCDENDDQLAPNNKIVLKTELRKYIADLKNSDEQKTLEKWMTELDNPERQKARMAARELQSFIEKKMDRVTAHFWEWSLLSFYDRNSVVTMANSCFRQDETPWVAISPDYNPDDITTPLLCSVTYTQAAYTALLYTLYGKDAVDTEFSYGALPLFDYRNLSERPGLSHRLMRHKPVELSYDTIQSTPYIHSVKPHIGQLIRHDLLSHNLIMSRETHLPMLDYLKRRLEFVKKFPMSKHIYTLVDLPRTLGEKLRTAQKNKDFLRERATKILWVYLMLPLATTEEGNAEAFWSNPDEKDHNLLLLIDMILFNLEWQNLGVTLDSLLSIVEQFLPDKVKHVKKILSDIVSIGKNSTAAQPHIYYVIAYRLRNLSPSLCEPFQQINLEHVLQWERNGGLRFYKDFHFPNPIVEKLEAKELHSQLRSVADVIRPHVGKMAHFSQDQAAIFSILAYRLKDHPQAQWWNEILKHVDLTKILRFRSTDDRLYFVDPATNNREPNLLTNRKLPEDNNELALQLQAAFKEVYTRNPEVFNLTSMTPEVRDLLGVLVEHKASDTDNSLKQILSFIQSDKPKELEKALGQFKEVLPSFVVETALESGSLPVIQTLLNKNIRASVNLRALHVFANRQQSNQRVSSVYVPEILCHLMRSSAPPDEIEAVMIVDLFHPEYFVEPKELISRILSDEQTEDICNKKTALGWWFSYAIREFMWHESHKDILRLLNHPFFPIAHFSQDIQKALQERQQARIPLVSKLSDKDFQDIMLSSKQDVVLLKRFEEEKDAYIKTIDWELKRGIIDVNTQISLEKQKISIQKFAANLKDAKSFSECFNSLTSKKYFCDGICNQNESLNPAGKFLVAFCKMENRLFDENIKVVDSKAASPPKPSAPLKFLGGSAPISRGDEKARQELSGKERKELSRGKRHL